MIYDIDIIGSKVKQGSKVDITAYLAFGVDRYPRDE